jgi:putative oxidoreductase
MTMLSQNPTRPDSVDLGAFVLRLSLGVMYIAHSLVLKYFVFTLAGTAQFFGSLGLPPVLAYVVFWSELIGGVMLVLGVWPRAVVLALMPVLVGALWTHAGNGWVFTAANGGWEYPLFLIVISGVQALIGDGAYALQPTPAPRAFQARTA